MVDARLTSQLATMADLDHRILQSDAVVEVSTRRGRTAPTRGVRIERCGGPSSSLPFNKLDKTFTMRKRA